MSALILGCFGALVQTTVKRMFAYTSINQGGFLVLGLITNSVGGLQASLIYVGTYMLTLFVFFVGISYDNCNVESFGELKNLSFLSRVLVALSLFSMAGIPPFFGFVTKYWI